MFDRVLSMNREAFSLLQRCAFKYDQHLTYNARLEVDVVCVHCGLELLHVDFEVLFGIFDLVCALGLGWKIIRRSNLSQQTPQSC